MGLLRNKRGGGDELIYEVVIFTVLTVLFFGSLFLIMTRVVDGASYYEQSYAKQISLLVDGAKPGTQIAMDAQVINDFSKKNKISLDNAIFIDGGNVIVRLDVGKGYSFPYFSNYTVDRAFSTDDKGNLILNLGIRENA